MSTEKNPLEHAVEQALDTFVYAPIGLLFDGPSLFPKLVEKGRNQVQVARMMGQFTVQMGQGEAAKRVTQAQSQLRDALSSIGVVPPPPAPGPTAVAETPEPAVMNPATTEPAGKKKAPAKRPPASAPDGIGIPDYDSLSASQVVSRLRGLGAEELAAVRDYESATRARKTILNKVAQLQKA